MNPVLSTVITTLLTSNKDVQKALPAGDLAQLQSAVTLRTAGKQIDLKPSFTARIKRVLQPIIGENLADGIFEFLNGKEATAAEAQRLASAAGLTGVYNALTKRNLADPDEVIEVLVDEDTSRVDGQLNGKSAETVGLHTAAVAEFLALRGRIKRRLGLDDAALEDLTFYFRHMDEDLLAAISQLDQRTIRRLEGL